MWFASSDENAVYSEDQSCAGHDWIANWRAAKRVLRAPSSIRSCQSVRPRLRDPRGLRRRQENQGRQAPCTR